MTHWTLHNDWAYCDGPCKFGGIIGPIGISLDLVTSLGPVLLWDPVGKWDSVAL